MHTLRVEADASGVAAGGNRFQLFEAVFAALQPTPPTMESGLGVHVGVHVYHPTHSWHMCSQPPGMPSSPLKALIKSTCASRDTVDYSATSPETNGSSGQ